MLPIAKHADCGIDPGLRSFILWDVFGMDVIGGRASEKGSSIAVKRDGCWKRRGGATTRFQSADWNRYIFCCLGQTGEGRSDYAAAMASPAAIYPI